MRKLMILSLIISSMFSSMVYGQKVVLSPSKVVKCKHYDVSKAIRDISPHSPAEKAKKWSNKEVYNNFEKRKYVKSAYNPLPEADPLWQNENGKTYNKQLFANFEGIDVNGGGGATPPDTDGDVGMNYYFQTVNTSFQIFDKTGNSVYGPAANSTIFDGFDDGQPYDDCNDGDPIVLYDQEADRWFYSQFALPNMWSGPYYILIAVSKTNDPTGEYYRYAFQFDEMPDYPKFAIWHDGYYMTLNSGSDNTVVFERDSMLVGGEARMITFDLPDYPGSGFKSALAADCDGTFPSDTTPNYVVFYNDDAWGTYPNDHLRVWKFKTDWTNTNNTTLALSQTINTDAFDSNIGSGWDNITQPGTSQKLDGLSQTIMFRLQFRQFAGYNAMVLNYVVDADGNDLAGIRWYELRDNGSGWSVYQQGTYAPDDQNRWCGSIAMDKNGNIGLGYAVSGSTAYPSIRYTGHTYNAPAGIMNVAENEIVAGTGTQSGTNRFGDYSCLSVDPTDDLTFWYTQEYIKSNGNWSTRIASFKLDPTSQPDIDAAVTSIVAPTSGINLTADEQVTVRVSNYGAQALSNVPVTLIVDGNLIGTETIAGPISAANYEDVTFSSTVDMSTIDAYNFTAYVAVSGDTIQSNDTINKVIEHEPPSYCDASGGGNYEHISHVEFNTIDNTSNYTTYSDYTNISTTVSKGSSYSITVTSGNGYSSDECIVWIDWNQDYDFEDSGEKVVLGTGTGPFSGNITVPTGAQAGSTRMRVRLHDASAQGNSTSCGSSSYGEVEDYTITVDSDMATQDVINANDIEVKIFPNPNNGVFTITMNDNRYKKTIEIINRLGQVVYIENLNNPNQGSYSKSFDFSTYSKGLYFVRVRVNGHIVKAQNLIIE